MNFCQLKNEIKISLNYRDDKIKHRGLFSFFKKRLMESFNEFLVFPIDWKTKIAFLSAEKEENSFHIEVDWSFPLNNVKPKMFLSSNGDDDEKQECKDEEKEEKCVHHVALSEINSLIAYTSSDKSLFVSKIEGTSAKTLSRRCFLRTASCIRFSKCGNFLYLADKTGEIFEYGCGTENINSRGKWIIGHISQVLDIQISLE